VRLTLIGLLALAMGGQNAVVRRLAVPDLTTTVLTLTVTGLVADTTDPSVRGSATDLGPGDARGCANRRCLVALGRPSPPRSGWQPYCWSPVLPAPIWLPAAHNRRPGGSPRSLSRRSNRR